MVGCSDRFIPQKYVPLVVGSSAGWALGPFRTRRDGGIRIRLMAQGRPGWGLTNRRHMAACCVTNVFVLRAACISEER
jgi:hypothetical protein